MALPDFLRWADLALGGQGSAVLPGDFLQQVVKTTGSRAGILNAFGAEVARWPKSLSPQEEEVKEGWSDVLLGDGRGGWTLRLLQPDRLDEMALGSIRLVLRAWDLSAELKRSQFEERFHLWELEAIRAIATTIGGLDDPVALAEELVAHLVALLGVKSAHLFLESSEAPVGRFGPEVLGPEAIDQARHEAIVTDDVIALPLKAASGPLGVLVVAHKEARAGTEPFAPQDRNLLELFALQVTVALEYARLTRESLERDRFQRELEVAATIQGHLLPQCPPDLSGFRIHAMSNPTRHVAGDTYDLLVQDGDLVVTVTDVSGKGVGAGLIASGVQAGVRLLVPEDFRLEDLASRLNGFLCGATDDNRFATFAMIRIVPDGSLYAVNAGHCPILVRRCDGRVEQIASSGLPLGILDGVTYETESLNLRPGDTVFLYTDGLTEAENPEEEEFGQDRLIDVVTSSPCE
ncbi:MAG: SpoIIE family protein phosphatase, partial [Acidobacteria bacterium]|nr:SpoIIE family protein phosphatase [Acidobacteriota bacterium]